MGRKPENGPQGARGGLPGGQLCHNPFAALAGKTPAPQEGSIHLPAGASTPEPRRAKSQSSSPKQRGNPGAPEKLSVRFEAKGHGGKTVTRISGLPLEAEGLKAIARDLKKAMGTGARVEDGDVLVQGKLVERVADWLTKAGHGQVIRGN